MAILEHEVRSAQSGITGLRRRLFSRDEYYELAHTLQGEHVELIEGEIIEMAPIGDMHAAVNDPLAVLLRAAFGNRFSVRTQAPIALGDAVRPSDPQPDIAVVAGDWREYIFRKPVPADIALLVEIADSSLSVDRNVKAALYASAGVKEYWIVNLIDKQLEVRREPSEDGYRSLAYYTSGESVTPLLAPSESVRVGDFMP